jgi:hypothetical protein
MQLSFHEGIGDHRTALVDVTTSSDIRKQAQARDKYLSYVEQQMETHCVTECLQECECKVTSYPVMDSIREQMQ